MITIYVDSRLTIGSDEGIKEVIEDLKGHDFGPKIEVDIKDYLSSRTFRSISKMELHES
jgi:hypothetical protein